MKAGTPGGWRRLWEAGRPPRGWTVPVVLALGALAGLGLVTVHVGRATSYLSDDPRACINCHVMYPQYATWQHGSHGRVAVCNDCHVPHDTLLRKFAFKAQDGLRHSTIFTLRLEPQVIRVKPAGVAVIQENCRRCHGGLLEHAPHLAVSAAESARGRGKLCWECHRETPHGRVQSLASTPFARVPGLDPVVPAWLGERLAETPGGPAALPSPTPASLEPSLEEKP